MGDKYKVTGTPFLSGFENWKTVCTIGHMNVILSNSTRSTKRDKCDQTKYTHMIPADAIKKIRSVTIYDDNYNILGFSFFDNDEALLWKIGDTTYWK